MSDWPLTDFITLLTFEGRALTRGSLHQRRAKRDDLEATKQVLAQTSQDAALQAPSVAPEFDGDAALWAAETFAWAAGMLVDRGETNTDFPAWLNDRTANPTTASAHWSVDLTFRFFSGLVARAEKVGKDDPLYPELMNLLEPWPLSSVGISVENSKHSIDIVLQDNCLQKIYVDRILITKDTARAESQPLQSLIENAVGAYPQLAPAMIGLLAETDKDAP